MKNKKTFREIHKLKLLYYILSIIVLFLPIYTQHIPGRDRTTSLYGFTTMAADIGWLYYIATIIGLFTVFVPFLDRLQDFAAKIISAINLFVTLVVYIPLVRDTIGGSLTTVIGSTNLSMGFWLTILLHLIGLLGFWSAFFMRISNKRKARQTEAALKEEEKKKQEEEIKAAQEAAEQKQKQLIEDNAIDADFTEKEL